MNTSQNLGGNTHDFRNDEAMDTEAIRGLQARNGLAPCFRTGHLLICTTDCQWRDSCRKPVAEWRRDW